MGFFEVLAENLAKAVEKVEREKFEKGREKITIPFDQNWEDAWNQIRKDQEINPHALDTSVEFSNDLLDELSNAISNRQSTERFPYAEEKIPLNNVGESFRQVEIRDFCMNAAGEDLGWIYGLLIPEMANEHDKNAVAVYAFREDALSSDPESKYLFLHAGYLEKESAKKVHAKILRLMAKDLYVPLLVRVHGGTPDKPNYGVFPYAMTDKIEFA